MKILHFKQLHSKIELISGLTLGHTKIEPVPIDRTGHKLVTLAAQAGSVEMLKCLLGDKGINKNSVDWYMLSILYWAVSSGNIEAVRYLLNQGVTMTSFVPTDRLIQCKDCRTNTICHYVDIEQLDTDPFMLAVRNKKADVVRLIDDYGSYRS